jgi:hypothetical protein
MRRAVRGVDRNGAQEHLKKQPHEYDFTQDFRREGATGEEIAYGNYARNTGAIMTDTTGPDGK